MADSSDSEDVDDFSLLLCRRRAENIEDTPEPETISVLPTLLPQDETDRGGRVALFSPGWWQEFTSVLNFSRPC